MSEITFAKSFLATLDSRPIKLRADHVFDPEQVGLRVPVSIYPGVYAKFELSGAILLTTFCLSSTPSPASRPRIQRCPRK